MVQATVYTTTIGDRSEKQRNSWPLVRERSTLFLSLCHQQKWGGLKCVIPSGGMVDLGLKFFIS